MNCAGLDTAPEKQHARRETVKEKQDVDLGLRDRVYLITGGSRGLGYAAAEALVAEGARVVVSARDAGATARAAAALGSGRAVGLAADNADPATPGRLVSAAREEFGRLDGALISVGGPPGGTAAETPDEAWLAAFGSVFLGTVRLSRALAAALTEGGSIAFVLSSSVRVPIASLVISNGLRPGLAGFAKTLADELGPRGIRVNGLLPGLIATDRMRDLGSVLNSTLEDIPLRRIGEPAEFGRAAAFVLSPAASYLTGTMLPVRRRRAAGHLSRAGDGLLAGELGVVQLGVQAARREQVLVRAAFPDPALVDDEDLVRFPDGGQPVRDDQGRPAAQRGLERRLHRRLRFGVQMRGRLVQHHHGRRLEQQPRDGQPLLLPARQPVAPVPHDRVEAVWQRGDEVPDLRGLARRDEVRLRGFRPRVAEVGPDRVVEHVRVLGDHAHRVVQRVQGHIAQVLPADEHRALVRVIEPGHQVGDRGLAGTGRPDQRGQLPGRRGEGDPAQHRLGGTRVLGRGERDRLERGQ